MTLCRGFQWKGNEQVKINMLLLLICIYMSVSIAAAAWVGSQKFDIPMETQTTTSC